MKKQIASVLTGVAALGAMATINAGTAHADVKSNCNPSFCIAADIYDGSNDVKRVADVTLSVRNGDARQRLKIFIASNSWTSPTPRQTYKVYPNRNYKDGTLICGSTLASTDYVCVKV
ncbi:hypothetical protein SAMN05661093_02076 [Kibdelosporangium aridum]|uniref:Peptidase inhibitor family I36 n=2 Tax=Kibdelosporangium aridum TaxID=2030 RepID=A0A1Y5XBS1_KIBAR|nr:hypothetical protein SAMN05661093_02076 [Kibdelosporangium aridum]